MPGKNEGAPREGAPSPSGGNREETGNRRHRTRGVKWRPAPASVRRALATGDECDYEALMAWWVESCPEHLRGLSPHVAALLSVIPRLSSCPTGTFTIVRKGV